MSLRSGQYRKIVARRLSTNFREATAVIAVPFPDTLRPTELLVRNHFVGINASDINFTAGIYQPDVTPPFDCGFEALGEVVAVGTAVRPPLRPGTAVVTQKFGSFAEFQVVPQRNAKVVPSLRREWLPLDLSGTTASIALAEVLRPRAGERAVVTAAAGGTGQFAVQLLRHVYNCPVVGTCSSAEKAQFLCDVLGCAAAVNYREGNTAAVIRRHFPRGVNVAYESVGGELLEAVVQSMALHGRIVSIGNISVYAQGSVERVADAVVGHNDGDDDHHARDRMRAPHARKPLPLQLLSHSASLHTFFLPHFARHAGRHFEQLCALADAGKVRSIIDTTPFCGLEAVASAVEHLHSGRNVGKVIVSLPESN